MYANGSSQQNREGFSVYRPILSPNAFAIATVASNICFGVAGLAGAYLLFGLLTGHLSDFSSIASDADRARILSNLNIGRQGLIFGAGLGALIAGAAYLTEEAAGYLLLFGAAVVGFGIPMLFAQLGGANFTPEKSEALRLSLGTFPAAALFPSVVAVLMIARDVVLRLLAAFQPKERHVSEEEMLYGNGAAKEQVTATHRPSKLPGRCWEGSYCRETIKVHCPVYISKTPCWKQKRGCYCDETIVAEAASRINGTHLPMASGAGGSSRFNFSAPKTVSTTSIGGEAPRMVRPTLTDAQKRERCRQCVIYNDHQQKKYNLFMPLTIAATVVVWLMLLTVLHGQVDHAFVVTLGLIDRLSFRPGESVVHQAQFTAGDASPFVMWPVMIACGIMLLAKTLQVLEWALFKLKI